VRAPPHGLSQLAASFLAYPRQGIPRAPLLRLTSSFVSIRTSPPVLNLSAYKALVSFVTPQKDATLDESQSPELSKIVGARWRLDRTRNRVLK
jgi:hypothetical protein